MKGSGPSPDASKVTPGVLVRSSLFTLGLVGSTLVFTPIALASMLLPYRYRWRVVTRWSRFNLYWLSVTCGVKSEVEGLENIPPEPTVILSRHESAWETLALQRWFAPQVWVLKRELLRIPFFGWGLATMRPIAIDRSAGLGAFEQMMKQGEERLANGCWVVVFPEGTRVPPGVRRRFKQGGARLAVHTGRPAVPIAHNAGDCWPRNSFCKYPRHHPRGHRQTHGNRRPERAGREPERRAVGPRHPRTHPRRELIGCRARGHPQRPTQVNLRDRRRGSGAAAHVPSHATSPA